MHFSASVDNVVQGGVLWPEMGQKPWILRQTTIMKLELQQLLLRTRAAALQSFTPCWSLGTGLVLGTGLLLRTGLVSGIALLGLWFLAMEPKSKMAELTLFNLNDISLLIGGFLSLVLSVLLLMRRQQGRIKRRYWIFLAVFFLLGGLRAFDTLAYWNLGVKGLLLSVSPNCFYLLGFVFFLQGPLLYWFTRAEIARDMHMKPWDLLHLLPALAYPFYIYAIYFSLPDTQKLAYLNDWSLVTANPWFESLIWTERLSLLSYSLLCVFKLQQYVAHLKTTPEALGKVDLLWLRLLLVGFVALNLWTLAMLIDTRVAHLLSPTFWGEVESHLQFLYMSVLVVYLLKSSEGFVEIRLEHTMADTAEPLAPQQQLIERLQQFMQTRKPYLEPHITVERLATKLDLSPKLLSSTINSQLNMNFFEFIGSYRLAEAKKKLADSELRDLSINEIMKLSGYSSKSVFNQAFKKSVGVTPSHYRQQYLGAKALGLSTC